MDQYLVVFDKKCDKGSKMMDEGNCEANPARFGGKKGMGATADDDKAIRIM